MKTICLYLVALTALATQLCTSQAQQESFRNEAQACFQANQKLQREVLTLSLQKQEVVFKLRQCLVNSLSLLTSPTLGSPQRPASSCKAIIDEHSDATSRVYFIGKDSDVEQVFCHMGNVGSCGGGGWTTLMKVDGRKTTFKYQSALWTNSTPFNVQGGRTGFDAKETKLNTYNSMPFDKLCVVFKNPTSGETGHVLINKTASSLLSVIETNQFSPVSVPRTTWINSIQSASLQNNCNVNGFNSVAKDANHAKARIGIIANNEGDCISSDSAIGVGLSGRGCGCEACDAMAAGNYNGCKNKFHLPKLAYVLAQ